MPIRMLKKEEDKKENKKKKPKGSSKLDIFKSYGKYDGKPVELKAGGLTGNQHKLDKNKDGRISGDDFAMMKMGGKVEEYRGGGKVKGGKKMGCRGMGAALRGGGYTIS